VEDAIISTSTERGNDMKYEEATEGMFIRIDFSNGAKFAQITRVDEKGFDANVLNKGAVRTNDGWWFWRTENLAIVHVLSGRPSKAEVISTYP